ncbi:ER lumen protein-retaining receptor [Clonorchis sinensis]|uniref:ER lumen protein-retaining receptor n=2 Tax=Clonorchis sinensis TaxID=79923 RepID=G7YWB1_CLOSI|nr:ER lumen protein-retaining receptor [Clonorchis sinensis]GAA57241.1 ER lumen protein retaining receptor [Clonorchis sinensis]
MEDSILCGQILFALVFTTRYLDLFTTFVSVYNSVAKVVFIISSYITVFLMYRKFKATYDSNHDTFRLEFLVVPCGLLALLVNERFTFLEAVAILPQLFLISKTGEAETITSHYLFALGSYRALYILNWVYRYFVERHLDMIAIVSGVVQTLLYCDFFYLYVTRGMSFPRVIYWFSSCERQDTRNASLRRSDSAVHELLESPEWIPVCASETHSLCGILRSIMVLSFSICELNVLNRIYAARRLILILIRTCRKGTLLSIMETSGLVSSPAAHQSITND